MEQELNYLNNKEKLIKELNSMGCNLLRDDSDIDFALLDKSKKEEVYNFLINEGFVCTGNDSKKMNFKKFIDSKIIDIDIDIEINTKYLKQYFYDIEIKEEFEQEYFYNPQKFQIAMKTVRYFMLLRGKVKKYRKFLIDNREIIENNNFYFTKLTKNPLKKDIDFDIFLKLAQADKRAMIKYIKFKYIIYFILLKFKYRFFKTRGKIIAIEGVDGAGKTTVIDILRQELDKPTLYMGERGFKYEKFYKRKKSVFLKPFSLAGQYLEKIYRAIKARKLATRYGIVICDRYHNYSKTASSIVFIDYFNKLFFFLYPKPDIKIVLWNTPEVILSRKQEVTKEYIEELNRNKELIYKNATFIKNDSIDDTLNLILKEIYA